MIRTKVIATIGPASARPNVMLDLVRAGIDVARINMSHGDHRFHEQSIRMVRDAAGEVGRPVAILIDLQGPKIRIGDLPRTRPAPGWGRGDDRARGAARCRRAAHHVHAAGAGSVPGHPHPPRRRSPRTGVPAVAGWTGPVRGPQGRGARIQKGNQPPGRRSQYARSYRQGHGGPGVRLLDGGGVRGSLLRAEGGGRPDPQGAHARKGVAGGEDRTVACRGGTRRDPGVQRCGDGRARRPGGGAALRLGAPGAEADHPGRQRLWVPGDHRHPDARIDDIVSGADPGGDLRCRQRDSRRHGCGHAVRGNRGGEVPPPARSRSW